MPRQSEQVVAERVNGRPGLVNRLESAVMGLKKWRWWLVGAAAGGGGVISVLAWVVTEAKR